MEQLNPIACELCRTKKCKCDRKLPQCSQCVLQGATCRFPQSNKRGIPTGYIFRLEQRLVETEIALFQTLSALHSFQTQTLVEDLNPEVSEVFTEHSIEQSKAAKDEEWENLPLETEEQRQQWWSDRLAFLKNRKEGVPFRRGSIEARQAKGSPWSQSVSDESNTSPQEPLQHLAQEPTNIHDMSPQDNIATITSRDDSACAQLPSSNPHLMGDSWSNQPRVWSESSTDQPVIPGQPVHDLGDRRSFYSAQIPTLPEVQQAGEGDNLVVENGSSSDMADPNILRDDQHRLQRLTSEQWQKYF